MNNTDTDTEREAGSRYESWEQWSTWLTALSEWTSCVHQTYTNTHTHTTVITVTSLRTSSRWWSFGMQSHQLDHVQTICTSLQTDNHTNTLPCSFLQASSWRPTNSVKALKAALTAKSRIATESITKQYLDWYQPFIHSFIHLLNMHSVQHMATNIQWTYKTIIWLN